MSDLQTRFEAAVAQAELLALRPDNLTLLKMYALYNQASEGDNTRPKPSFSDGVAYAKWQAWTNCRGLDADAARQQYIELIDALRGG